MLRLRSSSLRARASSVVLLCLAASWAEATTVTGVVLDSTTGAPLSGAEVLVDGSDSGVRTDLAGAFSVEVSGGDRLFTFRRAGFSEQSLGPVAVPAEGELAAQNVRLYPAPVAGEEIITLDALTVEAGLVKNSVASDRQQAAISVDLISAADFGKFSGSDIGDVIVRIPGLSTTSQGSFAVVRGLAERYNPVMLDGIVLPSSDPERQAPELDIFPSKLVDAIVVSKVFDPRYSATSSGGAIDLRTRPIPEERRGSVTVGLRADEGAIKGDPFLKAPREGTADRFGAGADKRPAAPADEVGFFALVANPGTTNRGLSTDVPFGHRLQVDWQDRIDLNSEGKALGYTLVVTQDRSASTEEGQKTGLEGSIFSSGAAASGNIANHSGFNGTDYFESTDETSVGLLASVGFAFSERHVLSATLFSSQIGASEVTRSTNGFVTSADFATLGQIRDALASDPTTLPSGVLDTPGERLIGQEEISYRERNLTNFKLGGDHTFTDSGETKVNWAAAYVSARQEEPNGLILPYFYRPDGSQFITFYGTPEATYTRIWRETEEKTKAARAEIERTMPWGPTGETTLRLGGYFDTTERNFSEVSHALTSGGGFSVGTTLDGMIDDIINDLPGRTALTLRPFADAERELTAVHLSANLPLAQKRKGIEKLELFAGVRFEDFTLDSSGQGAVGNYGSADFYTEIGPALGQTGPFPSGTTFTGEIAEDTWHPALALNYSPRERTTLRLSYSETVARPSFREVGPYFTRDEVTDNYQHGNVFLETSEVKNYDLRLEHFFENGDLVALSLFAKTIAQPIERITYRTPGLGLVSTWVNNPAEAELRGVEFELAKGLGFLGDLGAPFTVGGNFTYIDASVDRNPAFEAQQLASPGVPDSRGLVDQPEWIANAYITFAKPNWGFSTTLSYFAISDVLQSVNDTSWDTYIASSDRIDLTISQRIGKSWVARFTARNLADPERKFIGDPNATNGSEAVYRTFHDGRSYQITATYEF
jgi:outer membrane receptor protein involved in Fe transport